jgi:DNA-binding MarR family transcriptional regulator
MLTILHRMPGSASPPDALEIADHLHSAAIHLLRSVRAQDATLGVGPAQLSALSILVFGGDRTISALARAEQVRLPTMSRLVATLERAGLATRDSPPHDRRVSRVRATSLGRRVLLRGRAQRVGDLARRLGALAPGDRDHLGRAAALIERLAGMRSSTSE